VKVGRIRASVGGPDGSKEAAQRRTDLNRREA
jgi:hypothetical protein